MPESKNRSAKPPYKSGSRSSASRPSRGRKPQSETAAATSSAAAKEDVKVAGEKLQKVLARAGLGSRREMESWISAGRVKVNGEAAGLGDRVGDADQIQVDGKPVRLAIGTEKTSRVIVYNKPVGEVCTRSDPEGRPTVFAKLPRLVLGRWISVGRLDINTSGLLLFTDDGELANKLMHPSSGIDREYAVRIHGEVTDDIVARLKEGVMLEDGMAHFSDIQYFDGEGQNQWYHVVLMEGRNREVRRLWESQGVEVSRLKRVRYGCIFMPKSVSVGQWVELSQKELDDLCDSVALPRRKVRQKTPDQQRADRRVQKRAARAPMPGRGEHKTRKSGSHKSGSQQDQAKKDAFGKGAHKSKALQKGQSRQGQDRPASGPYARRPRG